MSRVLLQKKQKFLQDFLGVKGIKKGYMLQKNRGDSGILEMKKFNKIKD